MSDVVTRQVTVSNENGLHLVPCSLIAQTAGNFESKVELVKGNTIANIKNIFEIVGLAAGKGTKLTLSADGPDAQEAVDAIAQLFDSGFQKQT